MKAVKFDHYGDIDVLEVRDVPRPSPGPGEVQVAPSQGPGTQENGRRRAAASHLWRPDVFSALWVEGLAAR